MRSSHHKCVWVVLAAIACRVLPHAEAVEGYGVKPTFFYGAATAAYQVEGAASEGGRGASIWDTFSHLPNKVANNDTGDTADDFYHRYKEDIALMQSLGISYFRMSLSWSRILPNGTGPVNQEGLKFYHSVIDALIDARMIPFVTLYHWDLPQALMDAYGGWPDARVVADFTAYASVAFREFGDRVKFWTTMNEPATFCDQGYALGSHAPGNCKLRNPNCTTAEAYEERWRCSHHVLLAHAATVAQFRAIVPDGQISINLDASWAEPRTNSTADQAASDMAMQRGMGFFADVLYFGDYPAIVRRDVPSLPNFTTSERALLVNSTDFFALNHYTSSYAGVCYDVNRTVINGSSCSYVNATDGSFIGPQADSGWLRVVPWGLRKLLGWINQRYRHPVIIITENGVDVPNESKMAVADTLNDTFRIDYFQGYLRAAVDAVELDGVDLQGYFAWSLLDNFEWADGYNKRFGIVYVDYKNGLQRSIKASARWLSAFFQTSSAVNRTAISTADSSSS